MNLTEKRNAYVCQKCNKHIITVDRDPGVTPFMLLCRATPQCTGMMRSEFYCGGLVMSEEKPTFEWRRPTDKEYDEASKGMQEHFDKGGLDLHPIQEG